MVLRPDSARMDLSYADDIDTRCRCGNEAAGWAFGDDGRRIYVCPDCAEGIYRFVPDEMVGVAPHPRAERCRVCERVTLTDHLSHQKRCKDCQGLSAEEAEQAAVGLSGDVPPELAAAQADAEGAVDYDADVDANASNPE